MQVNPLHVDLAEATASTIDEIREVCKEAQISSLKRGLDAG